MRSFAVGDIRRNTAYPVRLAFLIQGAHATVMNPADGAIGTRDAVLDIVEANIFTGDPAREEADDPAPIVRMNRFGPPAGILQQICYRKAPDTFKARVAL